MARIILGYGDFEGHTLSEINTETLDQLSQRYPLKIENLDDPNTDTLLITIAVHQEVGRRREGGKQKNRVLTRVEMAKKLVGAGYHQLSSKYHPDRGGTSDEQRRLNDVRSLLADACDEFPDEDRDAIKIPDDAGPTISDEDIPF